MKCPECGYKMDTRVDIFGDPLQCTKCFYSEDEGLMSECRKEVEKAKK